MPKYDRILLKLSGESLAGGASFGINADRVISAVPIAAERSTAASSCTVGISAGPSSTAGSSMRRLGLGS